MTSVSLHASEEIKAQYHGLVSEVIHAPVPGTLILSYFGDITSQKVDQLIHLAETSILDLGDKRQAMKRVCSVAIEMLQNISIHGTHDREGHMHAFIVFSREKGQYHLQTGNLIVIPEATQIEKKLLDLSRMSKEEIRKTFIETLCNEEFSVRGGAGLGLLTIAKRSVDGIHHSILKLDDRLAYFRMSVRIPVDSD